MNEYDYQLERFRDKYKFIDKKILKEIFKKSWVLSSRLNDILKIADNMLYFYEKGLE